MGLSSDKEHGSGIRGFWKWETGQRDYISHLSSVVDKQHSFIEKQKSHIYDLKDKRDNAWSSEFRDKVEGWIEEAETKLNSAYSTISDLESKIQDAKSKLNS